jgi:hypothetical protein
LLTVFACGIFNACAGQYLFFTEIVSCLGEDHTTLYLRPSLGY